MIPKLVINLEDQTVEVDSKDIPLTGKAWKLLILMARHLDRVFTLTDIAKELWGDRYLKSDDFSVRPVVYRLRKALGNDYITTLHGVGYRLNRENVEVRQLSIPDTEEVTLIRNLLEAAKAGECPFEDCPTCRKKQETIKKAEVYLSKFST